MGSIKGGHLNKPVIKYENRFETYTEESAYWAGFIAADGCISNESFYLCLNAKDLAHIEKFKAYIGSTHKISVNTETYNRAQFAFVNRKINDDLLYNFNITERKTETYELPILPENAVWPFIRGYFDGDGCICESFSNKNSKKATLYTTIVGSYTFIDELYRLIGINGSIQERAKVKTIKYCSNSSLKLLDKLYSNSNIHLDRKYNYYQEILKNGVKSR